MGWRDWLPPWQRTPALPEPRADAVIVGPTASNAVGNRLSGLGGLGDKGAAARPEGRPDLALIELEILYRQGGYSRRIVELIPKECARAGWYVSDSTDAQDVMRDEDRRLHTTSRVREAWTFARLFGGAVVLMVTDDALTPADLRTPLDPKRVRQVRALQVYDRFEAVALSWETDPTSADYARPNLWNITPRMAANTLPGAPRTISSAQVHGSRVLYFGGAETTHNQRFRNAGHDDSTLESCWEAVRNKGSIDAAGAFIAQELMIPSLEVANLEAKSVGDEADLFRQRMSALAKGRSMLNMILLLEGEKFSRDTASVSGFRDLDQAAAETLASHTGIPLPILMGRAPGGLNADGESHRDAWTKLCSAEREEHARDPLRRLYSVIYASKDGPTRGVVPDSWDVEFAPLDEPGAAEIAATRKVQAETDQIYLDAGVLAPSDIVASRFGEKGWQDDILPIEPIEEADIPEPIDESNAPPPAK